MDGHTWTSKPKVADAINRSQAAGSGAVVLNIWDPEEFEELCTEFVGICSEQERFNDRVYDFKGDDEGSKPWAVQLCLCPH